MRAHHVLALAIGIGAAGGAASQGTEALRYVESSGVRIRYVDRGQGPVVLLVHGLSVNIELNWGINGVIDSLARSHRVVALDLRGHGRSDKPHDPAAYGTRHVQDVVTLLDSLHIDRVHVVGYSLGAAVATKLLVSHPERVASVVLGGGGWVRRDMPRPAEVQGWLEALERAARDGTPVYDAMRQPGWPEFPAPVVAMVNQNDPVALAASIRGDTGLAVSESELRRVTVPVLAVVGANDALGLPVAEAASRVVPGMRVQILPGLDHLTAINHPLFLQSVLEFLGARASPGTAVESPWRAVTPDPDRLAPDTVRQRDLDVGHAGT